MIGNATKQPMSKSGVGGNQIFLTLHQTQLGGRLVRRPQISLKSSCNGLSIATFSVCVSSR